MTNAIHYSPLLQKPPITKTPYYSSFSLWFSSNHLPSIHKIPAIFTCARRFNPKIHVASQIHILLKKNSSTRVTTLSLSVLSLLSHYEDRVSLLDPRGEKPESARWLAWSRTLPRKGAGKGEGERKGFRRGKIQRIRGTARRGIVAGIMRQRSCKHNLSRHSGWSID